MRRWLLSALLLAGCLETGGVVLEGPLGPSAFDELRIEPPRVRVLVENGEPRFQSFRVFGVRPDGTELPVTPTSWDLTEEALGFLDGEGVLELHGLRGGQTRVVARLGPDGDGDGDVLSAGAVVEVEVSWLVVPDGIVPEVLDDALAATPTPSAAEAPVLRHPLPGVEVPDSLPFLELQWDRPDRDPAVVVQLSRPDAVVTLVADGASAMTLEGAAKIALLETSPGSEVTVTIGALDEEVLWTRSQSLFVLPGPLLADLLYFEQAGRLIRVDHQEARRTALLPSPPPREGDRCVGCHAVAADGELVVAALYDVPRTAAVFSLEDDLSLDPAPLFPLDVEGDVTFSTIAFDEEVIATVDGRLRGFRVAEDLGASDLALPDEPATMPSVSPDGDRLAYIAADNAESFDDSTLRIVTRDEAGFGPLLLSLDGATLDSAPEGGEALAHPTFAPEPNIVVVAHGPRSALSDGGETFASALYLVVEDREPVRLTALLPGAVSATWPRFAPEPTGTGRDERFWLAFMSLAPFGNDADGTRESPRRQIWIASIDPNAPDGIDPSHPPFRAPGQDLATANLGGVLVGAECVDSSDRCTASSQCCDGQCRPVDDPDELRCL